MIDPIDLETAYQTFTQDLAKWAPDGITPVNLALLQEMGILKEEQQDKVADEDGLSHYFHVIETDEKVTLYNQEFAIWIAPEIVDGASSTLTYVALLRNEKPKLEAVFSASGVYNAPKYILKVLQHFLKESAETEKTLSDMDPSE